MDKLTLEEAAEIVLTEEFAEMKYKELTQDWDDVRRDVFYDLIKQKFQPLEILGLNWGVFLDMELVKSMDGYEPAERVAYIARRMKEEGI